MMDYQFIAQEILGTGESIMLSPRQIEYLENKIKQLPENEQIWFEESNFIDLVIPPEKRRVLQKLREDDALTAVLGLGLLRTQDLIDITTLLISEDYKVFIEEDENGNTVFATEPANSKEEDLEDSPCDKAILAFLKATIPAGVPSACKLEGTQIREGYIDEKDEQIDYIYLKILENRDIKVDKAVWMTVNPNIDMLISPNTPTNDDLLQFFVSNTEAQITKHFGDEWYKAVKSYFEFWIGDNFWDYADGSDFR